MSAPTLRARWLTAMRASTDRAVGRECDFAMSEGDADKFDPLGLLAELVMDSTDHEEALPFQWRSGRCEDGACVSRQDAARLAALVGFPPDQLALLAHMSDRGDSWGDLADFVEGQCAMADRPAPWGPSIGAMVDAYATPR